MRKSYKLFLAALVALPAPVLASDLTVTVYESMTWTGVDSWDAQGDSDNVLLGHTWAGGYMADAVRVSGTLTEVNTGTFANEARIDLGGLAQVQGSTTGGYSGTINVSNVNVLGAPADPAGHMVLEFYESFDDGADAIDQTWDSVTVEWVSNPVITNGNYNLGALPTDGTVVSNSGHNVAGGLDFYQIEIGAVGGAGSYLNIQTTDPLTGDNIDTELGIYDAITGDFIGTDDDGQVSAFGGLYSMLSFGADDPFFNSETAAGADGLSLPAGLYTVVVGGFNTNFGANIADLVPGTSAGDYDIHFSHVPEPATLSLLAIGLGLAARRRR